LAGVFSAYRPPAFGVGGFSDKFNSLHTYGLAVDMRGIGTPGSAEAELWAPDSPPKWGGVSLWPVATARNGIIASPRA
jgi:hypothetical protein